jgi:hypothetical protein
MRLVLRRVSNFNQLGGDLIGLLLFDYEEGSVIRFDGDDSPKPFGPVITTSFPRKSAPLRHAHSNTLGRSFHTSNF